MKLHSQKLRLLMFIASVIYNSSMKGGLYALEVCSIWRKAQKAPVNMITHKLLGGIRPLQEK